MDESADHDLVLYEQPPTAVVSVTETPQEVIAQYRDVTNDPDRILSDYLDRLAQETKRRHVHDLRVFCRFLADEQGQYRLNADPLALEKDLLAWLRFPMCAPLLEDYVAWLKEDGYAIGSINVRLMTIKAYCKCLVKAQLLTENDYAAIERVEGIPKRTAENIDASRRKRNVGTRKPDARKAQWVELSPKQVKDLLAAIGTETPIARRDNLLIRLSWLHALRVGEVVALTCTSIDVQKGIMTFDRPKVHIKGQRMELRGKTLAVARAYIADRQAETTLGTDAPLFASYKPRRKGEPAEERPILPQIASRRVAYLAKRHLGIDHVSFHDGRHYWATDAFINKSTLKDVMEGGGWSTPYIPLQYAARLAIANKNVRQTDIDEEE